VGENPFDFGQPRTTARRPRGNTAGRRVAVLVVLAVALIAVVAGLLVKAAIDRQEQARRTTRDLDEISRLSVQLRSAKKDVEQSRKMNDEIRDAARRYPSQTVYLLRQAEKAARLVRECDERVSQLASQIDALHRRNPATIGYSGPPE
jgi:hypothetical protein